MKLSVEQKMLFRALERGAMAALSDEAQSDTSNFAPLIKSVKITVGTDFIVESGTGLMSSRWSIPATKDNGFDIKEQGEVLIPAKELVSWVSKQSKSKIVLSLSKLKEPEVITNGEGDLDYGSGQNVAVKKIGNLKLASRDETKTGNRWSLDCYDATQKKVVDFSDSPKSVVTVPVKQLVNGLKNVGFSTHVKDIEHVFDNVVLESFKGDLYMAASDMHRCSIYKLDAATGIDKDFFTETADGTSGQKVLIPYAFLQNISKLSQSADLQVSYDEPTNKIYLSQDEWDVRLSTVESSRHKKFPTVAMLMAKPYKALCSVPKGVLANRLISASLVNKAMVLFDFSKEALIIHAVSESGHAPNVSNAPVNNLSKDLKVIWGVQHLMDVIRVLKDDDISFSVPDDNGSVKVSSEEDKNLHYFTMSMRHETSKYAQFFDKVEKD